MSTKRIPINPGDLTVVPGPSYEINTEDGPASRYDYFVVYRDRLPEALTLDITFHYQDRAEQAMVAFEDCGEIYPEHWEKGDPWLAYHGGMSLRERLSPYGPEWENEQRERGLL